MIENKKDSLFSIPCISDVRMIRKHDRLIIGDGPDALDCHLLNAVTADCNWPSQWHSRFPHGYIGLRKDAGGHLGTSRYFYYNIATGTVGQTAIFLFRFSEVEPLWRRQYLKQELARSVAATTLEDLVSACQLLQLLEPIGAQPRMNDREQACRWIVVNSEALSLSDLEQLMGALGPAKVAA